MIINHVQHYPPAVLVSRVYETCQGWGATIEFVDGKVKRRVVPPRSGRAEFTHWHQFKNGDREPMQVARLAPAIDGLQFIGQHIKWGERADVEVSEPFGMHFIDQ